MAKIKNVEELVEAFSELKALIIGDVMLDTYMWEKVDVIIFEDYDKGVVTKSLIEHVVKLARKNEIPVAVDPKKKNFKFYKNVNLFKPNMKELQEGMKIDLDKSDIDGIRIAAEKLS